MTKPFFIDMDQLRVGSYEGTEVINGERYVYYWPINSLQLGKPCVIRGLNSDQKVLQPIQRVGGVTGTQKSYMILLTGENNRSWFLDDWLGSILPQTLAQMKAMKEKDIIRQAALETRERQFGRGEQAVLQDVKKKQGIIDTSKRDEDPRNKRNKGGGFFE